MKKETIYYKKFDESEVFSLHPKMSSYLKKDITDSTKCICIPCPEEAKKGSPNKPEKSIVFLFLIHHFETATHQKYIKAKIFLYFN